jgi:hypothetical protein
MFWKRITVEEQERALVAKNGRLRTILTPGNYRIFVAEGASLSVEKHTVSDLVFQSIWADYLVRHHPELTECHFYRVETKDTQIALVYVDGELHTVLTPSKRILFWRGLAEVTAEFVEVIGAPKSAGKNHRSSGSALAVRPRRFMPGREKALANCAAAKLLA